MAKQHRADVPQQQPQPPTPALGRGVFMLLAALVSMAVAIIVLVVMARQAASDIQREGDIEVELTALNQVLLALLNAETGQRGYLLTARANYLEPYREALLSLDAQLKTLQAHAAADDQHHQARQQSFEQVRERARLKLAELALTIRLHDGGDHPAAMRLILSDQGQQHMEALRSLVGGLQAELRRERTLLSTRLSHDASDTKLVLLIGLAALTLFSTLALWQLLSNARQLRSAEERIRAIADNVPALITQFDREGKLVFVNAHVGKVYGLDPQTLMGKQVAEIRGEVLAAEMQPHIDRVMRGENVEFESHATIAGRLHHFSQSYVPDIGADGEVQGFYSVSMDITPMKLAQQQLSEQARADALTGLPNRRQFDERLALALARVRRDGSALALLFLDIDHFKAVNDSHGHAAGDQVLQEFAVRLLRCVRSTDLTARLAGDEFVILLEGLNEGHDATAVAGKILLAMQVPISVGQAGLTLQVSTSIGVALAQPGAAVDGGPQTLMARADQALYQAKHEGRNRYVAA